MGANCSSPPQITGSHSLGRINSGAVGPEATEDLLPQFHHPTIAFREVVGEGHTQLPPPGCIATFFLRIALMKQFEPNIREEEALQETL